MNIDISKPSISHVASYTPEKCTEPDHVPVIFVNLSDDCLQLTKHIPVGSI